MHSFDAFAFIGMLAIALHIGAVVFQLISPTSASGPDQNRILNYQLRLTDANGIPVADGAQNVKLTLFTASSAGTQLYTACSADGTATGTPTAVQITFTNGVGTVLIGSTTNTCQSGTAVAIPATLFNNTALFLGVTVGADAEMTPRKRIVSAGYALNADALDDLDSSSTGGTGAFVPATNTSGRFTLTGDPTSTAAVLTVNPATAQITANDLLLDLNNNGSDRFTVDAEGDVFVNGNVSIGTATPSQTLTVVGTADISGHTAIGANATINDGSLLYPASTYSNVLNVSETSTNATVEKVEGITSYLNYNPSASASIVRVYAVDGEAASAAGNAQNIARITGGYLSADHNGTGTVSGIYGLEVSAQRWAGTVTIDLRQSN